jgi:peptidoglycan hydrolase CwlO-like protein
MMLQEIKEFYDENKSYCITCLIVMVVCIAGLWLVYDAHRNDTIHNNTDNSVERLEKRLDDIGQRIDGLQKRNEQNQKTVERTIITVERGRENAVTVADGIGEAERRLDNAIQASGRIQNRIADIESQYR